ncbi:MAG: hypothetical protein NTZ18_00500 [Candidatus Komeilibacteria bacterium]|nr:hypothetical protein [Candidatus Komeilibacteria bacterium]
MELSVLDLPEHLQGEARMRLSIVAEFEPLFPGLKVKVHLPGELPNNADIYRVRIFQGVTKVCDISAKDPKALLTQAQLQNGAG